MNKCVIIGGSHFLAYPLEFWKGECVWVWVPLTHARWSCLLPDLNALPCCCHLGPCECLSSMVPSRGGMRGLEQRVLSFLLLHLKGGGSLGKWLSRVQFQIYVHQLMENVLPRFSSCLF